MSQVLILIINVLFAKNWLKFKVLFCFKLFSFVSSCINEIHIFCFPSKLSFRFPFHSVFHSVPFSVPRFSYTPCFNELGLSRPESNPNLPHEKWRLYHLSHSIRVLQKSMNSCRSNCLMYTFYIKIQQKDDFLSVWLIFAYQHPHHRINKN